MSEETYNGWRNRETWIVGLWLGNEEHLYRAMMDIIREIPNPYMREDALRELINDEIQAEGFTFDLVNTALNRVDWQAIIEGHADAEA